MGSGVEMQAVAGVMDVSARDGDVKRKRNRKRMVERDEEAMALECLLGWKERWEVIYR